MKIKNNNKRQGFTLLETIISLALLSILFLTMMNIFGSAAKNISRNAQDINNSNLAKSELNLAINDKDYKGQNQQITNTFVDVEVLGTKVPVRYVSTPVENGTNGSYFIYVTEGVPVVINPDPDPTPDPDPDPDNKYTVTDDSNIFLDFNDNGAFDKNTSEVYIDEECLDDFRYYGEADVVINGFIDRGNNPIHMEMENDFVINPGCGIESKEDMYFKASDVILSNNSDVVSSNGSGENITFICDNFFADNNSSVDVKSNNSSVYIEASLDVVLQNGSNIETNNRGDITINCRNLLASDGSDVYVRNGGNLYVNTTNDIKLTNNSYLATNNGALLEVNCGNNIDLDMGYISVGSNTDIIVNATNDINLLNNGYMYTESGIITIACNNYNSNSGKLEVNGNANKLTLNATGNVNITNNSELISKNDNVVVDCYNYISDNSKIDISKSVIINAVENINLLNNTLLKSSNSTVDLECENSFIKDSKVSGNSGFVLNTAKNVNSINSTLSSGNGVVTLNGDNIYFDKNSITASGDISITAQNNMQIKNKSNMNTTNNEVIINSKDFVIDESTITAKNTSIKGNTAEISGTSSQYTTFNNQNGTTIFDIDANGTIYYGKVGEPSAYLQINTRDGYLINKNGTKFENLSPEVSGNKFK